MFVRAKLLNEITDRYVGLIVENRGLTSRIAKLESANAALMAERASYIETHRGHEARLLTHVRKLEEETKKQREACAHGAAYLEALQSDLIANDVDMMIDTPVSPAAVAADMRAALAKHTGG